MFVNPHDVPPLFCFDVQTDMCFLLLQLMSPEGRRCKKFDVRSCCNKKNLMSVCTLKQSGGGILCGFTNVQTDMTFFYYNCSWHQTFYNAYPLETWAVVIKIMSVCTWKQNSGDTPCGFTNIKSNWNISRSDEKCSPVHKYWLNQSLKHQWLVTALCFSQDGRIGYSAWACAPKLAPDTIYVRYQWGVEVPTSDPMSQV